MDIVKYFYEEPVHLEALSAEADPDARRRAAPALSLDAVLNPTSYYRGYIAGSHGERVGATALDAPEAFVLPLLHVLGRSGWVRADRENDIDLVDDPAPRLLDPVSVTALAVSAAPVNAESLAEVASVERRYGIPALRRLLDAGATVLFPEPAHDGSDWSLFAPEPLHARLVVAFRAHPAEARRFVLPYHKARSEHKFYFERWALDDLPDWIEEL